MKKIFIDNEITENRCCQTFLTQQRSLHSFFDWSDFYELSDDILLSEYIIVISCVVVPWSENKTKEILYKYIKNFPEKKIICYGCFSIFTDLLNPYEWVVEFIWNDDWNKFNSIFSIWNLPKYNNVIEKVWIEFKNNFDKNFEWIIIWHWCLWNCYYCNHKLTSKLYSKPFNLIKLEVLIRLNKWINHFRFISHDIASYWFDFEKKVNYIDLLKNILKINNKFTFSAWPIYPRSFLENKKDILELFSTWRVTELFVAIEHFSPKVLKLMNRNYDINEVLSFVKDIKIKFPKIKICTHIIYWYPWETLEDLKEIFPIMDYFDQVQMFKIGYNRYLHQNNPWFKEDTLWLKLKNQFLVKYFKKQYWIIVYEDHRIILIKEQYWTGEENINYYTF